MRVGGLQVQRMRAVGQRTAQDRLQAVRSRVNVPSGCTSASTLAKSETGIASKPAVKLATRLASATRPVIVASEVIPSVELSPVSFANAAVITGGAASNRRTNTP